MSGIAFLVPIFIGYPVATGQARPLPADQALRTATIRALWKDREGLLWAVNDKGLLYPANVRFGQMETPFTNTQAVLVDQQDRRWAGCQEGLFLQENGAFKKIFPQKENVISL
ncbi:MAG: hypothetical protein LH618_15180 [Saprospiraceae bacterium]|nr:hypothetical protein [Saprospiraceae bacterium]